MSKKFLSIAALLALLNASTATAITWGEPDAGEHPNVGVLTFPRDDGFHFCTGTMIAPRVMLTAAHCVSWAGNINDFTYVRFTEDALSGIENYSDPLKFLKAEWLKVETVIPHPLWPGDFSGLPYTYDVGVVILKKPYEPTNGFGSIPPLGFLENLIGEDRQSFTVVGYGYWENLPPYEGYEGIYGQRRKGEVRLLEVESYISGNGEAGARFSNNPGIEGGVCDGDSGGPYFYKNTNFIVAVTSFSYTSYNYCVGNEHGYRLDIPATQEFLYEILKEYGG